MVVEKEEATASNSSLAKNITETILTNRSSDCADCVGSYTASVNDIKQNTSFTMTVDITDDDTGCTLASNTVPNHNFNDDNANCAHQVQMHNRTFTISRLPQMANTMTALSQNSYDAVMLNGAALDLLSAGYCKDGKDVNIGCSTADD